MVRSPDGVTFLFKITTGVLQGDTFAPFIFIVFLDYVLNNSAEFTSGYKLKSWIYTITKDK